MSQLIRSYYRSIDELTPGLPACQNVSIILASQNEDCVQRAAQLCRAAAGMYATLCQVDAFLAQLCDEDDNSGPLEALALAVQRSIAAAKSEANTNEVMP